MISNVSVPSVRKGSPVQYSIVVTLSGGEVYEIEHRFNDFLDLTSELEEEVAETCPVPAPKKRWLPFGASDEVLEDRRMGIEVMLRALIRDPLFSETLALQRFLDVSRHRLGKSADGASWVAKTSEISRMLADVRQSTGNHARERLIQARAANGHLQELLDSSQKLGQGEKNRRQLQIDNYTQAIMGLDGSRGVTAPIDYNSSNQRASLFQRNEPRKGRVLGETDTTKRLNNHGLMDHQQLTMENQDEEIEQLRLSVARQHEISTVINEEVMKQNNLLDDLDEDVHRVNARVNQARRKTAKIK